MTQIALQRPEIFDSDERIGSVSYVGEIDDGETLSGTPTVTEVTTSDLTISNVAIGTTARTINKKSVAANKYVTFFVKDQVSGKTYTVDVRCGTSSDPAQNIKIRCFFTVT